MTKFFFTFLMGLLFLAPLYPAYPHEVNGVENHSMVDILDPELRKIVAGRLAKAPTDPITADDMKTLTTIFANGPDIRHLRGLEHAVNLTSLQLRRPPPQTQAELNLRPRWRTDDLAPLTKLTNLEHLTIQGSVVFDMTPIANLTNLGDVALVYTYGISRIPDLSKLTELVHLRLEHNRITDISGVSGLTNLRQLRLESNRNLSDITPLTQLNTLEILRLDNTLVTHESLSAVLPFMSTEIDQMTVDEYPPTSITSGEFGISGTNISDLSVLDNFPDVFLWGLYLRFLGSIPDRTFPFHLKDLTPLVDLMNKGKLINGKTSIYLLHNYGLDYESLYEDIPALLADTTGRTVSHPKVEYAQPNPMLEREFPTEASYTGVSRTQYTFKVRAINTNPEFPAGWVPYTPHGTGHNRQFAKVPVTWKVTAPDGTVTEQTVLTGDDGVSSFPLTLGDDGETHTVEAIVPAKTTSGLPVPLNPNYPNPNTALSHGELKVTFTAEAVTPLAITLTLDNATYTDIQWIADVSGRPLPGSYAYYYKKSADREWIKVTHLEHRSRRFSFIHSELQPGTSYDFQLVGLRGEDRIESNVLTARTLSRTPPEPPPEPPVPANNPPVFTSAASVNVAENTTAVIRIVAEDPDSEDEITGYAITGGADQAMLEIGGTGTPSDMLHFKAAPDFENPQDADTDNVCILTVTATSGVGARELTATQTLTITVTDVDETPPEPPNNPPVFTSASAVSVQENTTAVITVVAEDPDAEDEITGYAITGGADQALFELSGTGTPSDMLRFKTAPDFEMPGSAANSNVYTLILTATSGVSDRELTATQTLIVTVTDVDETPPAPVNRPPVFRSASTVNVAENTTAVVTIVAEDPDAEDAITGYAITGGADQALFEIHGTNTPLDMLRFKTAPDFETPKDADKNNVYTLILTATSGVGDRELTAIQTLTVTVTDVDETPPPPPQPVNRPPVFTSAASVNVPENTTAVITVVAEDPDAEDAITGYAITGGADASLFEFGGTNAPLDMLRFKTAPDFEMPQDADKNNVYTLILTATSGVGDRQLTATQTLIVTVTDVDETPPPPPPVNHPPVFRSASTVNIPENTTAVITVVAEDPDAEDAITNYAITGGVDAALFELGGASSPLDMLRFKTAPDFEMPQDANKDNVYTVFLTATSGVGDRELTAHQTLTITVTDVDETPPPPIDPPVEPPAAGSGPGAPSPIRIGIQSFIFSEIGNFSDDRNDWIELTNVCNTPLDLSEWQVRLIRTDAVELGGQIETDVISFCDFLLPPQAVLLVASTDPSVTRLASGFNIATGARSRGAQHPYFVAPDLRLPSTPFLLILQRVLPGTGNTRPTLMDVAGSLFLEVLPDGSEVYFDPDTPNLPAATAPLTEVGVYERQHLEYPGYLASAWGASGYRGGIGYDRHVAVSMALGTPGYRRDPSPSQPVVYRLIFNEIRNASNDTNDWIELKNICGAEVQLKHWHISIVRNTGGGEDEEIAVVSLPDYTLPMGGVLLITNTDPSETVLAGGLNIATGRRSRGAQHPYLVAPGLRLPETPYLLILEEVREYGERRIEDVAGSYALTALPDGTEIHPQAYVSHRGEPLAPLAHFGAWQRRHFVEGPGYLASAWMSSGYHEGIGYDRDTPAAMCLGTPGYRHDPSPVLPETQRLAFNKIHNAGDDADNYIDYIELKNISDTGVRLKHWAISSVASAGEKADEDVDIVSFPDWTLPAGGVLLVLNTEPGPVIFNGRNIAMDAEPTDTEQTDTQQTEAQRDYFVAPDLQLPQTPYLLILRHALGKNGTSEAIEDVAGDYFRSVENTQVWPLTHTLRPSLPAAPLSEAGTWQRTDARQRGYTATAWRAIESPLIFASDPDAFTRLPETQRLIFNKIHNASNNMKDWIELKNISDTEVQLKHWTISRILSVDDNADEDVGIVSFPDWTLPVGGVLLITNTEPDETVLIDGLNITPGAHPEPGAQQPYLVAPNLRLPSTPYLLILRHALGKNGTSEAIEDMVGDYFQSVENTADWLETHIPHPSAPVAPLSEAGTWQRTDARQRGYLATAWTVSASPPGLSDTPTAPDGTDAHFATDADAAAVFNPTLPDEVRITELMYETEGPSGPLPEWIELYNASATPVDLQSWQLRLENRIENTHRHATLKLKPIEIPAKQTVLLVNGKGRRAGALPPHRIYDLSAAHWEAFGQRRLKNTLLSRDGFFLQLIHPTGRGVDTCGNLDGDPTTDDPPAWTLPVPDSKTRKGHRFSLLRRFDGDVRKGTEASGWMPAIAVAIGINAYYGHPSDISTPGFLHPIVPGASPTVALSISELMFTTQTPKRDGLPQWIELYNPSFTGSVNLKDFQLVVETRYAGRHQQILIDLQAFDVLPNQTVVLITARGRHSRHFAENRTYNLSQRHPKAFRSAEQWQRLLGDEGFLIQLTDATGNVVDTVGNLDGYPFTEDTPAWTLPEGETPDGARASIRRLYEKRRPLDGRHREAWVSTATVPPVIMTYGYGDASDVGNPGYRMGGPLPVVLSSFGARRNADDVVVSWTTESSLENAGFHLYRSTARNGGFVRVNPRLIQGAGTTAEKQTYTYVDNPPKADGVYYYQIEEVSFSGQQQVLATARMKGYLSADGKHLTTLGALKTGGGVKDK